MSAPSTMVPAPHQSHATIAASCLHRASAAKRGRHTGTLNHLLLKCLWNPPSQHGYAACFTALATSYLSQVDWEPRHGVKSRTAHLLPGLFIARIDGKSPVEYITDDCHKALVRATARSLLARPVDQLTHVLAAWESALAGRHQSPRTSARPEHPEH